MITFERTIDIPASRRISFTAPVAVPVGRTNVLLVFPQESSVPDPAEAEGDAEDGADATEFINRNPAYREHVLRSIDEARQGKNLISIPAELFRDIDKALAAV